MADHKLPKITVITPSFNQGQFIEETIQSVVNQNYPNLEYWVIDGGSSDETVEVLKRYEGKLQWVSEPDQGQADAINKGLKKATGEIVAYLNSDDVMVPGTLRVVGEYFSEHPNAQWLTGDYSVIDEHGKQLHSFVTSYKRMLRKRPNFSLLAIANFISQPSTYWRRELIKEVGFFDTSLHYCLDYDYWLRIITRYQLHTLKQQLSLFRIHTNSKGRSGYVRQFEEEHEVLQRFTINQVLLTAHKLHAFFIIQAYRIMK